MERSGVNESVRGYLIGQFYTTSFQLLGACMFTQLPEFQITKEPADTDVPARRSSGSDGQRQMK